MSTELFRKQALARFLRVDAPGALVSVAPSSGLVVFGVMASLFAGLVLLTVVGRVQIVAEGRGVAQPDEPPIVLHAPFAATVLATHHAPPDRGAPGDALIDLDARADAVRHDRCVASLGAEQRDLDALEKRLHDWDQAPAKNPDAALALVLIAEVREQRQKVSADRERCDALGAVVEKSHLPFPVDAVVLDVAVTDGAEVKEGDVLATLAPAGARVVGYLALPEAYRGEVAAGQLVQVKYDALPFDDVGAGTAHVTRLLDALPSGVRIEGADRGGVFVELTLDSMPTGGGTPRAGMTFTADVLTRRPRIASLLFGSGSADDG
jgi:biotin carboxyl carrier protein